MSGWGAGRRSRCKIIVPQVHRLPEAGDTSAGKHSLRRSAQWEEEGWATGEKQR